MSYTCLYVYIRPSLEIGFMARKFASVKNSHHCSDIHFILTLTSHKAMSRDSISVRQLVDHFDWKEQRTIRCQLQQQSIRRNKPDSALHNINISPQSSQWSKFHL